MKIKLNFLFSTERPHFSQGLNKVSFTPQGFLFINCIILLRALYYLYCYFDSRPGLNYFSSQICMATSREKPKLILALYHFLCLFPSSNIFSMSLRCVNIVLYSLKFANCKVERKSVILISKTSIYVHIDLKMFDFEVPVQSEIKLSFSSILAANRLSFISCLLFGTLIKLFWRRMAFQRLNCLKMFIYNFTLYAQHSSWAWIIKFCQFVQFFLIV